MTVDKRVLMETLLGTFVAELEEHLRRLSERLLTLESETSSEQKKQLTQELFRGAHSLKGAARVVEQTEIADLCHALEDFLASVRDGARDLQPTEYQLLFSIFDRLQAAALRVKQRIPIEAGWFQDLMVALRSAAAGGEFLVPPTSESEPLAPDPPSAPLHSDGTIRVSTARLDTLLAAGGELLHARHRLAHHQGRIDDLKPHAQRISGVFERMQDKLKEGEPEVALELLRHYQGEVWGLERALERFEVEYRRDVHQLDAVSQSLEQNLRRLRMVPFGRVKGRLERAVRDVAQAEGKTVELVILGEEVEIDRTVLDGLLDGLAHLVRNAAVHGAEAAAVREAVNKPPGTRIEVSAVLRGLNVEITVIDDGPGLDRDAILARGEAMGLAPSELHSWNRMIFIPELSTATEVTQHSGRGMGLDVVLSQVEALHGTIEVSSESGQGCRFAMTVPLTLTRFRALVVKNQGTHFCVPSSNVVQLLRISDEHIQHVQGRAFILYEEELVVLVPLSLVLGQPGSVLKKTSLRSVMVVAAGERRAAFLVDDLVAEQEVVVKNLGRRLLQVRYIAGATLIASQGIGLILNAAELVRSVYASAESEPLSWSLPQVGLYRRRPRILLVDDTLTTRSLVKTMLQGAGYDVTTAENGAQAWTHALTGDVDVVVADVEMPQLDGFSLTEKIRGSSLKDLPVVLLTGRARPEDRARGLEVGANAYLVKQGFDQSDLLATLAQLV